MAKIKYQIPVKCGTRLELLVETLGASGDGIAHHEGYTLFVPEGLPGDRVYAEVNKTTTRWGSVRTIERLSNSPDRIPSPCEVFPKCGGCQLLWLNYDKQIEYKKETLSENLKRIGKFETHPEITVIPSDKIFGYRNKGIFPVQQRKEYLNIGFYEKESHFVIDSTSCDVMVEPINAIKESLRKRIFQFIVTIYNEKKKRGFLKHIIIRRSPATEETLLGFVTTPGNFPAGFIEKLTEGEFVDKFNIKGIVQNINDKPGNAIFGSKFKTLWGQEYLNDRLGDLQFHLSLGSFAQINSSLTLKLYQLIEKWVDGQGLVVDAYCGSGGISLWLAQSGRRVIGIDESNDSINDARKNAELNKLDSCEFWQGPVESYMESFKKLKDLQTLIIDPPRKGCSPEFIAAIEENAPAQIIYVSCNPSTLARDLNLLSSYRIEEIALADMFPHTRHIETAVRLQRISE